MEQILKNMLFIIFLSFESKLKPTNALICYACNSNWEACGIVPNLSLIRYNKEICRGPCRIWKHEQKIYRGCSDYFLPDNASVFVDQNGITYKYCYQDLCNVDYEEAKSTQIKSITIISKASTLTTPIDPKTIQCYFCNERWKGCADPVDLKEIKFSVVECIGVCVTWLNEFDNNFLYRGCLKNTSSLQILNDLEELSYYVCSTDFCNDAPLNMTSAKTTLIPKESKDNTTTRYQAEGRALLKSNLIELGSADIEYNDENEAENDDCYDDEDSSEYHDITVELEIKSTKTLLNSTKVMGDYVHLNNSETKSITCFFCNARWPACGNPPNLDKIRHNTVECVGVCVSWYNPWDKNLLYRGCSTQIINGSSGIYFDKNGLIYNYCSTDYCNIDTGISLITKEQDEKNITSKMIEKTTGLEESSIQSKQKYLVTFEEFCNGIRKAGYDLPTKEKYINFVSQLESQGGINSKREAAMFLSQILWESDGLKAKSEYACIKTQCPGMYGTSRYIGKSYYGRGYIQLSWHYNYEAASRSIFGDDRLLREPNLVSQNDKYAWATAFWFWKTNVGSRAEVKKGYFGSSTMAINGGLECNGPHKKKAMKRFEIYKIILKEFNLGEVPIENGCYN